MDFDLWDGENLVIEVRISNIGTVSPENYTDTLRPANIFLLAESRICPNFLRRLLRVFFAG